MSKKCAVLFSGGKDSCLALHMAKQAGYDVRYLLCVLPKGFDSFMFHKPDLKLLEKQAEMLNIDLVVVGSEGVEEKELDDLKKLIEKVRDDIDVIVAGGIASSYQAKRIKKICSELGLKFYAPLWDFSGERVWGRLFNDGFKVILTKISCEGLGKEWLGKVIDKKMFEEMKRLSRKHGFRIDFEGGEAETSVVYMPGFRKEIKIKFDVESEGEYRHFLKLIRFIN